MTAATALYSAAFEGRHDDIGALSLELKKEVGSASGMLSELADAGDELSQQSEAFQQGLKKYADNPDALNGTSVAWEGQVSGFATMIDLAADRCF
jgi:hypothetical protein